MLTLCIDTSAATALALVQDGETLASRRAEDPRRHAEELGVLTAELASNLGADSPKGMGVDQICVGTGPGPFTGLRSGIAFAGALGEALDVPVLGVWSQEAFAAGALLDSGAKSVLVVSDARRGEVYWGIYQGDPSALEVPAALEVVVLPSVGRLDDALEAATLRGVSVVSGPEQVVEGISGGFEVIPGDLRPELLALFAGAPRRDFGLIPLYLRRPDIQGQPQQELAVPSR